jgi:hypothetical protein
MNKELQAILAALAYVVDKDNNMQADLEKQDIEKARELSTAYVKAHREEFKDFEAFGNDQAGIQATVNAAEVFRAAGMKEQWARAEAWHFHTWEPQNVGGTAQPQLRIT